MTFRQKTNFFFRKYVQRRETNRVAITAYYMTLLLIIIVSVGMGIKLNLTLAEEWKSILMVILGMLIGNFSKIVDYWFNSMDNDKHLIDKADEEDDHLQEDIK